MPCENVETSSPQTPSTKIDLRLIPLEEGTNLRRRVLRPGIPGWEFPFHPASDFFHMGAFRCGQLVSVVSFLIEPMKDDSKDEGRTWRLRGMATELNQQRRGIGGQLLEAGLAEVMARNGTRVWCYGRTSVEAVYLGNGFRALGEAFDIPGVGLHALYVRDLMRPYPRRTHQKITDHPQLSAATRTGRCP
ncbi:GNAT family N-acetyltransferase [Mesorhizobium sp. M0644]|uniref:GNAT family N-acetyltransferase n=1 Tax=unclassified Mesorhizobium TaxID=325217 RepID=UPI00333B1670